MLDFTYYDCTFILSLLICTVCISADIRIASNVLRKVRSQDKTFVEFQEIVFDIGKLFEEFLCENQSRI